MTQFPSYPSPPTMAPPMGMNGPAKTSVMAIVSLVLGILGFCSAGLLGLVGLILGIIAIAGIRKSNGSKSGSGLAIAGITVGACSILMCPLYLGLLLPALAKARQEAHGVKARGQLMTLAQYALTYEREHHAYPPPDDWRNAIDTGVGDGSGNTLALAEWPGRADEGCAFAMNINLAKGKATANSSDAEARSRVLFFEVAPGSPLAGGPELLPRRARSSKGILVVYTDGHAENVPIDQAPRLPW